MKIQTIEQLTTVLSSWREEDVKRTKGVMGRFLSSRSDMRAFFNQPPAFYSLAVVPDSYLLDDEPDDGLLNRLELVGLIKMNDACVSLTGACPRIYNVTDLGVMYLASFHETLAPAEPADLPFGGADMTEVDILLQFNWGTDDVIANLYERDGKYIYYVAGATTTYLAGADQFALLEQIANDTGLIKEDANLSYSVLGIDPVFYITQKGKDRLIDIAGKPIVCAQPADLPF